MVPKVSTITVIIPTYNAARFITKTIESLFSQSFKDWRLIIVDDGSSDETVFLAQSIVASDARVTLLKQSNSGVAAARNTGFEAASPDSDYILFLDHDDVLMPDMLAELARYLDGDESSVAAHGLARKIDSLGKPIGDGNAAIQNYNRYELVDNKIVRVERNLPTTSAVVLFDNTICTPGSCLIRYTSAVQLFARDGYLFDTASVPLDDWDFWCRLTTIGSIGFVDKIVLDWRRHDAAGSTDIAAMSAAELRIRERLIHSHLPDSLKATALYRYQKLLTTRKRRAAREAWKSSVDFLRKGSALSATSQFFLASKNYGEYLRLRSASK